MNYEDMFLGHFVPLAIDEAIARFRAAVDIDLQAFANDLEVPREPWEIWEFHGSAWRTMSASSLMRAFGIVVEFRIAESRAPHWPHAWFRA